MTTVAAERPRAAGGSLAGTGTLVRFILRRDRIRIAAWILSIVAFVVLTASSFPELYRTAADRQARAELIANPAGTALAGPGYGLDDYTFGAMLANEMLGFTAVIVALMSVLMVVRHTRGEEAAGRAEIVRSGIVGRIAPAVGAFSVVVGMNVVLGALFALGLGSIGVESITWPGSWLFGAALASVGVVFAAVGLLTAQVSEGSRAASGMAGGAIAVAYTLRAAGDMGGGTLSWLSPIGWAQATRVYVDDRWWPLLLSVALTLVLVAVAIRLGARRDIEAGLLATRPGPGGASEALSSSIGLAFRLHRGSLIAWTGSLFLLGAVYGTLAAEVERFIEEIPALEELLVDLRAGSVLDSWLGLIVSLLATATGVYALLATSRLRGEESAGRAEPVLATASYRTSWIRSHLVVALAGSVVVLVAASAGLGFSAAIALGDGGVIPSLLGAALSYIPAVWVVVGLTAALFGVVPRFTAAAWVVVAYALLVGMLGGLLGLPDWAYDLSPFAYVPLLPAEELEVIPVVVLLAIAAALIGIGIAAFRRRDLATTA